jgi:putative flippase GtrA
MIFRVCCCLCNGAFGGIMALTGVDLNVMVYWITCAKLHDITIATATAFEVSSRFEFAPAADAL